MLRACDFNTFYSPRGGGVRQYLERKIEYFGQRNDVAYSLVVPGEEDTLETVGTARLYTLKAPLVIGSPDYRWLPRSRGLRRILKAERPHILEVGAPYLSPWTSRIATRGLRTRLVGFWHAHYPTAYVNTALSKIGKPVGRAGEALAWRYARMTYGRYDAVFAASEHVARVLRRNKIGPVYRTPLGVDIEVYHPQPELHRAQTVVWMTRLAPEKDFNTFRAAWFRLAAKHPRAQLVIAGDGPLREEVEVLAATHENINYLGWVSDQREIARVFASATVVVSPGSFETFSLATLEALACGTPVVATNTGAAPELVRAVDLGGTYRHGDADDLARALGEVLMWSDDERRTRAEHAREVVEARYSWDQSFAHILDCYKRVVGEVFQ